MKFLWLGLVLTTRKWSFFAHDRCCQFWAKTFIFCLYKFIYYMFPSKTAWVSRPHYSCNTSFLSRKFIVLFSVVLLSQHGRLKRKILPKKSNCECPLIRITSQSHQQLPFFLKKVFIDDEFRRRKIHRN